jgi:GAF domain-containing protein
MNQFDVNITAALDRVARSTVPALADFCLIYALDDDQLRCIALAHRSRAGRRALQSLARVYRITRNDPDSTVAQVVRSRRPSLRAAIRPEPAVLTPHPRPRVFALHRQLGARSALVVPLETPDRVIGALALSYGESGRRYVTADIARARKIAGHVALLLQHAPILTLVARQERMLSRMFARQASSAVVLRAARLRGRS